MNLNVSLEQIVHQAASLDRNDCIAELRNLPHLKLDFNDEFLQQQSVEKLRHILVAASLQARRHLKASA